MNWPLKTLIYATCFTLISCGHHTQKNRTTDQKTLGQQRTFGGVNHSGIPQIPHYQLPVLEEINQYQSSSLPLIEQDQLLENIKAKLIAWIAEQKKAVHHSPKNGEEQLELLYKDLYLKGDWASINNQFPLAATLFEVLYEQSPLSQLIVTKYIFSLIRAGFLEEAKSILKENYQQEDYFENLAPLLAKVYLSLEEKEQALELYKQILKKTPKNEEACLLMAKTQDELQKEKAAFQTIKRCQKHNPKNENLYLVEGKLWLLKGKGEKALRRFKKAQRLKPESLEVAMVIGGTYEQLGKMKSAIKVFKKALTHHPQSLMLLEKLAQLYLNDENYNGATPLMEQMVDLDPENLNLQLQLGLIYMNQKKYALGTNTFSHLLKKMPGSHKVMFFLGQSLRFEGESEQAREILMKITPEAENFQESQILIADILSELALKDPTSEKVGALEDFVERRARENAEIRLDLSLFLANFYDKMGKIKKSIAILERLKAQTELKKEKEGGPGGNPGVELQEGHLYYLASLYEKNKQFAEAYESIHSIIEKNPENAHAWNFLGYSLLERNVDLSKAYKYIQKAISLSPKDGHIRDSLGWYYYKTGQFQKALKEIRKALEHSNDEDPIINSHLGHVYKSLKRFALSKKYFKRALKFSEKDSDEARNFQSEINTLKKILRAPAAIAPPASAPAAPSAPKK